MALLETDPVCFRTDADGRLRFPLELASGLEAAGIGARRRVLLFAGEWFANFEVGIKYLPVPGLFEDRAAILGRHFDAGKARSEFRRELLTTPGALDVTVLLVGFDAPERRMTITFVLRTIWGATPRLIVEAAV